MGREGRYLTSTGREFHTLGTEAEKERCLVDLRVFFGMTWNYNRNLWKGEVAKVRPTETET